MTYIRRIDHTIDGDVVDNPRYVWESGNSSGLIQFRGQKESGVSGADLIDILSDYISNSKKSSEFDIEFFILIKEIKEKITKAGL